MFPAGVGEEALSGLYVDGLARVFGEGGGVDGDCKGGEGQRTVREKRGRKDELVRRRSSTSSMGRPAFIVVESSSGTRYVLLSPGRLSRRYLATSDEQDPAVSTMRGLAVSLARPRSSWWSMMAVRRLESVQCVG
jgi:hypothetical protein